MKFYIERLGCPKNDVDADYIAGRLIADGHEQALSADDAEAVIVNTCGFILPAKQESIGEILRYAERKKSGSLKRLIAAGCLSQKHGGELLQEIPELDTACGLGQLDSISSAVGAPENGSQPRALQAVDTRNLRYLAGQQRDIDSSTPYAYLKISDGCDRKCSYCVIPQMRGSFRSRPIEEIIAEAKFLAECGKRELILVSQEATLYGADTGRVRIIELLDKLQEVDGVDWIRLMYLHPQALSEDLINYLTGGGKVVPYFDLPLQHINSDMLRRMRRQVRREKIEKVLADIRSKSTRVVVRTTFIVGFPGETDEQFGELHDFVEDYQFDRMGAFAYSREDGSSAALMPDQVPEEVARERLAALTELQRGIAERRNEELIGARMQVMVDRPQNGSRALGRTYGDCPDIDQVVYLEDGAVHRLQVGQLVDVEITGTEDLDLVAKVTG